MAKRKSTPKPKATSKSWSRRDVVRWVMRWTFRALGLAAVLAILIVISHSFITPPKTAYMRQEQNRLVSLDYTWMPIENVAPVMARAAVAAEDANFCEHWGFDMEAIRIAIEEGGGRGASTISQQVVKNVYLWHGRSWVRKALEALLTPVVEVFWSKRRIIEVYLNIAEFDEGVFGVEAAAHHYFGVSAAELSDRQAARLAAVLPNPKDRSASNPSSWLRNRAAAIQDGAATIRRDGRSACFED